MGFLWSFSDRITVTSIVWNNVRGPVQGCRLHRDGRRSEVENAHIVYMLEHVPPPLANYRVPDLQHCT